MKLYDWNPLDYMTSEERIQGVKQAAEEQNISDDGKAYLNVLTNQAREKIAQKTS